MNDRYRPKADIHNISRYRSCYTDPYNQLLAVKQGGTSYDYSYSGKWEGSY